MADKSNNRKEGIPFDLPVNREIIFSNHKDIYKKRIERRQRSLMMLLSFLKPFLEEGEEILLITTGCSPVSFFERFWTGLNVFQLKCSILIFTDRRIFHVPTKKDYSYRNSIAHFFYSDCISIRIKGLTLVVMYKNGKKEKFHHIAISEEKKIKALLKAITLEGTSGKAQDRVYLCPRCTGELEEAKFICPNCNLEFKERTKAKKISILYPGGGYFFTRHPFLGIADALVESIFFALVIFSLAGIFNGVKYSGCVLLVSSFALVFEKMLTVYHSNTMIEEYIPKDRDIDDIRSKS